MKPITILAESRRLGRCRSCGAPIEWATVSATGKSTPFNPPIVLMPALHYEERLDVVRVDLSKTTSHFSTCPQADGWRRRHATTRRARV